MGAKLWFGIFVTQNYPFRHLISLEKYFYIGGISKMAKKYCYLFTEGNASMR